jgi:7-cyano-7-deazaguanine reductase
MNTSSIDYAEGRVFTFEDESSIRPDFLQTINYSGPRQRVSYQMKEFAAVCPFSGLPDTGIVWVDYIPNKKLVELKSLKYYFISFRNVGIYQEDVTSRIFNDLYPLLEPEELLIKTLYSTRGGIVTTCSVDSNEQKN